MRLGNKIKHWFWAINQKDVEHSLYWLSILLIPVVIFTYAAIYQIAEFTGMKSMTTCMLKSITGIPCPGCGGTRSVLCLIHGRIFSSLYYNAFATYTVIVYGIFLITQTLQRLTKGRIQGMKYKDGYIIAAVVILVCQYLLKLIIPGYQI